MSVFQTYLIYGPSNTNVRTQSKLIAKNFKIDLEKVAADVQIVKAPKTAIQIEQIREIKSTIFQKPLVYKNRIIIIENTHTATTEAQNALLKLLEEPPDHAVIILEAKNKEGILETIQSRVIKINTNADKQSPNIKILANDIEETLENISSVDDPEEFLDAQMIAIANLLSQKAIGKNVKYTHNQLTLALEKCKDAKVQIQSNIYPTFALANLAISLNLASK